MNTLKFLLLSFFSPLLIGFPLLHAQENHSLKAIIDRCMVTITEPVKLKKAVGFETLDLCAALGNGNLMLTLTGGPDSITIPVGKTDFWMDRMGKIEWQSSNVLAGNIDIIIPSMHNASFSQTVDMFQAEARTTLTKGVEKLEIRSVTPHEADNYIINDLVNSGKKPVFVTIILRAPQHIREGYSFDLDAGIDKNIFWIARRTPLPAKHEQYGDHEFRMWASCASKVLGAEASFEKIKTGDDSRVSASFTVNPGKKVRIVTKVNSTGLPITPDPENPVPTAVKAVSSANRSFTDGLVEQHRQWWADYWKKSYIKIDAEPVIEKAWYGALYIFASGNKTGQWAAGCNSWPVDDRVMYGGDYHWNYNNQAVYYGAYSANRVELTEPYDRSVLGANIYGKRNADSLKVPGTLFFIGTAPGHLNEPLLIGQRTHAVEAALNLINRYYYTYDTRWAESIYPFLRDVALYWDHDLEKNRQYRPDGTYRYVITESDVMELTGLDRFNSITAIAFLKRFYSSMIDITRDMNEAGYNTGYNEKDIERWSNILLKMSDYPLSFAYGRKVFAWSEQSLNPFVCNESWLLYPIFPGEQVSLSSDSALLSVARNTLNVKPHYYVEWLNNTPNIFAIAARVHDHPAEVIERFRTFYNTRGESNEFLPLGINNFKSGGGNFENTGIMEAVNNMMLQSHEGFLRMFPCWPHPDAFFSTLRASGAFLVTAEKSKGVCREITILSEKGRSCSILNPWPGLTLTVKEEGIFVPVTVRNEKYGQVYSFETTAGSTYKVMPSEALPHELKHWNAALYRPVSVSSEFIPPDEKYNWGKEKLTDGTRINSKIGHRGWTSNLHDAPDATEWVQVDLGEPVPVEAITLWPLDHGDAWNLNHNYEPFVRSSEIDQTYDGFPVDFRILISMDGETWSEEGKAENYCSPNAGSPVSDLKPRMMPYPETFIVNGKQARYIRLEVTKMRKTRYFGKYAAQFSEIEVRRQE